MSTKGKARAVKPAERAVYDACHDLFRQRRIYGWWIDPRTNLWSVQEVKGHYALRDVPMAEVAAFLGLASVTPIRKPSTVAALRARIAVLEAALSAAGLAVAA